MLNVKAQLHAQVINATESDVVFLKDVVALFTDPAQRDCLDALRAGKFALVYSPATGQAYLLPVTHSDTPPLPAGMLNFIARFDHAEWKTLASTTNIRELVRLDLAVAEARARAALGYLPGEKQMEIGHE